MNSKSDSLSLWGTVEDDDHIMVELISKKQHLCYITQVQQKNQESEECVVNFLNFMFMYI
jgi:hypothetical protein